jgi:hypothetical protein
VPGTRDMRDVPDMQDVPDNGQGFRGPSGPRNDHDEIVECVVTQSQRGRIGCSGSIAIAFVEPTTQSSSSSMESRSVGWASSGLGGASTGTGVYGVYGMNSLSASWACLFSIIVHSLRSEHSIRPDRLNIVQGMRRITVLPVKQRSR